MAQKRMQQTRIPVIIRIYYRRPTLSCTKQYAARIVRKECQGRRTSCTRLPPRSDVHVNGLTADNFFTKTRWKRRGYASLYNFFHFFFIFIFLRVPSVFSHSLSLLYCSLRYFVSAENDATCENERSLRVLSLHTLT